MQRHSGRALVASWLLLAGCGDDQAGGGGQGGSASTAGGGGAGGVESPPASEDWTRDILSTDLALDLSTAEATATIVLAHSESLGASFEIGDLTISAVRDENGPLQFAVTGAQLDVGVPVRSGDATVIVDYQFAPHDNFDGWNPEQGISFLWPTFCGNLFPCKSDPAEGVRFAMEVNGISAGATAVFPTTIPADAPSYMPAIAVAEFTEVDLGTTAAGTAVKVWHLPGQASDATTGTAHLVDVFDFYESTYGAYSFGDTVGSVSADWGGGDFGGMEHHPFWHVSSGSMDDEIVHAHEAAHGWFGNGVRIACWEDFVLSEGTVTYMAARALEASGVDAWATYECQLKSACTSSVNTIALPDSCGAIEILTDPLWSIVPYMKGAFFYRAVADEIGADLLDQTLAEFYQAHVGQAASEQDIIDLIKTKTDAAGAAAIDGLAEEWLRTLACPVDPTTLCN